MILVCFAALIPVGFIVFLALSKKTSPAVRKASIAALILTGISFAACAIIIVLMYGISAGTGAGHGAIPVVPAMDTSKSITPVLLASLVVVLVFLILVIILAIREHRRK